MANVPSAAATALKLAYVAVLLGTMAAGTLAMVDNTVIPDAKVEGAEFAAPKPSLHFATIRNETFQKEATAWFDQHWGLRGYAVRTDNTIGVKLFGESRTDQHAVVGRNGVLFTRDDLAYVNRAEPSTEAIALAKQLGRVQTKMRNRKIVLVPIVVPSKTSIHREAIPQSWRRRGGFGRSDSDLYGAFVRTLKETGTLFVDARALLTSEGKKPEEIFERTARHWRPAPSCRTLQAAVDAARPEIPELGDEQIDCRVAPDPTAPIAVEEFDIFRLLNTWDKKPEGVVVDQYAGKKGGPGLHIPTLIVGSSFVWNFAHMSRELDVLSPSLVYFYDESVTDPKTRLITKKVVPFTDDWRKDTFARRLILVAVLETFLPADGQKFLNEVEKELDANPFADPPPN